jgi:hypothetical protein
MDSIPKADPDDTDGSQGKPKVVKATKPRKLTWDKLEQIGLGELGMTYKEMWSLTPRSFFNAVNGSQKKRDYESRERYMIGRRIMYAVVQCNSTQDVKNTSYGRSLGNLT